MVSNQQKGLVFSPSDEKRPRSHDVPPNEVLQVMHHASLTSTTYVGFVGKHVPPSVQVWAPHHGSFTCLYPTHFILIYLYQCRKYDVYLMYRYYISNIQIYCIMYIDMYIYMCIYRKASSKPHCCSISTATPPFGDNTWGSQTN